MGNSLFGKNVISFLEILQSPIPPGGEMTKNARTALEEVAESMHIGRVTTSFFEPRIMTQTKSERHTLSLFESGCEVCEDALVLNFCTREGGEGSFSFFARKGYLWDEEQRQEVLLLGNLILWSFRVETMDVLLKRTMTTDLAGGIPNMAGFMECLVSKFTQRTIENYIGFYLNTHNFKYVNKVLSHQKGDMVMKQYIDELVRGIEADECVARLGGDNFVALIRKENADAFINKVSDVRVSFQDEKDEKHFGFGATIGASELVAVHNPGEVMVRISNAYQVARQKENKEVVYYSEEIHKEIMRQKEVIAGFYRGIENREFEVYYQPKVWTVERRLCGAEALVRWKGQDGRLIPPMEFIPMLEKEGSICVLDFYVLDKVCEFLSRCIREERPLFKISVNFSKRHVLNPRLVGDIVAVLDKYGVPHKWIEIELTESEDAKDYIVLARLIDKLKEEEISVSVDDFGTGYSSLNMLKMVKTDILKIDKSLIPFGKYNDNNHKDCIMFESIVRLAKALGFRVIAEGVETQRQYDYMKEAGCDMIQGFYFDKPLPVDEFLSRMIYSQY